MRFRTLARCCAAALAACLVAANASAESWVREVPAADASTLRIDLDFGSVSVASHAARTARIEADVRGLGASAFDFQLRENGDHITLTGRAAHWLDQLASAPGVELLVRVPADFSLEIVTHDGTVDVASVRGAVVRTQAGSVRVRDIRGEVNIQTGEGGEIEIDGVSGGVVAETWNAPIRARFQHAPTGRFHSRGGGIEIAYPAGVGTQLSASSSGCVWIDRQVRSGCGDRIRPVVTSLNGGGLPLDLRAGGGNIVLRAESF